MWGFVYFGGKNNATSCPNVKIRSSLNEKGWVILSRLTINTQQSVMWHSTSIHFPYGLQENQNKMRDSVYWYSHFPLVSYDALINILYHCNSVTCRRHGRSNLNTQAILLMYPSTPKQIGVITVICNLLTQWEKYHQIQSKKYTVL